MFVIRKILLLFIIIVICLQLTSCQRVTEGKIENDTYTSEKFAFKTPSLGFKMKAQDKKISHDQIMVVFENDVKALVAYEIIELAKDRVVLEKADDTYYTAFYKEFFQAAVLNFALSNSTNFKIVSEEMLQIDEMTSAYFTFVIYPERANYGTSDGQRSDLEVGYLFSLCDDMLVIIRSQSSMLTDIARKHGSDEPNTNHVKEELIRARKNFYSLPKKAAE